MHPETTPKHGLGTAEGVFIPTILTILGVVLYLRLGWVVGNAGFAGTLAIIIMAHAITVCTALSMASMVSNIEIGAGGAYTIISRSLGLEIGGAIGIPLYFSQAFSVAFYIIGFTELWHSFFPHHSITLVGVVTWAILTALSLVSASLAFRIQYGIVVAIMLSIVSFLGGPSLSAANPVWLGNFSQATFWETFAIFFPAVTGILAGVSMSGELRTPRASIIKGTLGAILAGFIIYVLLAYWFARQASPDLLLSDTSIILKLSFFKPFIIAGILGATLSSALSTLVSAPRTLAALADNRLVPAAKFLGRKSKDNEPRIAIIISSLLSLSVLVAGNLNELAQLLTMFFLTTYGAINLVVLAEQVIGITSFRPRLQLSISVPFIGFFGCIFTMLLINKLFTIITFAVIFSLYILLTKKALVSPWGDVRGGIFTAIVEWGAQRAMSMSYHPRLWKPSVLVPVENPDDLRRIVRFVQSILYPSGRLYSLTIIGKNIDEKAKVDAIHEIIDHLKEKGLFIRKTIIQGEGDRFEYDLSLVTQTLLNSFLPPNSILFTLSENAKKQERLLGFLNLMRNHNIGLMCLRIHPKFAFGQEKKINLWLRDKSPNMNLAVLIALQLTRNWDATLHILRAVSNESEIETTTAELETFIEKARLPMHTKIRVVTDNFRSAICKEAADITIIGMPNQYDQIIAIMNEIPHTVLCVADSGLENAIV